MTTIRQGPYTFSKQGKKFVVTNDTSPKSLVIKAPPGGKLFTLPGGVHASYPDKTWVAELLERTSSGFSVSVGVVAIGDTPEVVWDQAARFLNTGEHHVSGQSI